MKTKTALIIGGGALGLFTAYYLIKRGIETTVVDKSPIPDPGACSAGNAGMLVPSHFIRLANRSTLKEGIHSLFKPTSPMGIKWSVNPELFGWLWDFYRKSIQSSGNSHMKFLSALHLESRNLYNQIQVEDIPGLTMEMSGLVMASVTEKVFSSDKKTARIAADLGMPVEIWQNGEFTSQNPDLSPGVYGAVFYPLDGKVDPLPMLTELRQYLQSRGVRFLGGTAVTGFISREGRISAVSTTRGDIAADHFVVCTGAVSGKVLSGLGLRIPLQPAKGISYQFSNPGSTISHPTLLQDHHIAITPYETATRIAGNFILGDNTSTISGNRLQRIYQNVRSVFPGWEIPIPDASQAWWGARPVTPDGMPAIGTSAMYPNLSVNTGHAMMGISLAPVSGKIMAGMITGDSPDPLTTGFLNPGRFGNRF